MHSILFAGDIRHHHLAGKKPTPPSTSVIGGWPLMHEATRQMLECVSPLSPPVILPENPANSNPFGVVDETGSGEHQGILCWDIVQQETDGKDARYCICDKKPSGWVTLPVPDNAVLHSLMTGRYRDQKIQDARKQYEEIVNAISSLLMSAVKNGAQSVSDEKQILTDRIRRVFESKTNRSDNAVDWVSKLKDLFEDYEQNTSPRSPDVIVFDDLGINAGKLTFHSPSGETTAEFARKYWTELVSYLEFAAVGREDGESDLEYANRLEPKLNTLNACYFRGLVRTLEREAAEVEGIGAKHPVEPVIILSAAGKRLPTLCVDDKSKGDAKTFWQHIHSNPALRRRTVVLLDAETLRNEISVSSGLSWERTAQDTIVEFKRSKKLRPYLRFGHIIVRYGLTGALLISGDSEYTLYFDPDQDDVEFTHNEDGDVLGSTSVLAATIVEQLNGRCEWRNGRAVLPDLKFALNEALQLSIHRMMVHFELGFGKTPSQLLKKYKTKRWFDKRVFVSRAESINQEKFFVQCVKLLPFRSRYWSILSQSSQTDLNNICRSIVCEGPKVTLNTLEAPIQDFATLVLEKAQKKLEKDAIKSGRRCSFFLDSRPKYYDWFFAHEIDDSDEICMEIASCLENTLDDEWECGVREFIGKSQYQSIIELKNEVLRLDSPAREQLSKICFELRNNYEKFDLSLEEIAKCIFKGVVPDEKRLERIITAEGFKLVEKPEVFLLLGLEHYLEKVEEILPHQPELQDDSGVADAYRNLRNEILRGILDPEDDAKTRKVRELFIEIERKSLYNPFQFLLARLVELIQCFEPCEGWGAPVSTPILRLGPKPESSSERDKRLIVLDRREIESIRAVKRMVEQYLRDEDKQRPLSIAVFGPPGSGKSLAVKKIVKMMRENKASKKGIEVYTVNMSQVSSVDELHKELQAIHNESSGDKKIPVVFFDEFDSAYEGKYGWLKHFLGIMEDSKYRDVKMEEAVFVFAGGTCNTFEEFSLAERSDNDPQWAKFSEVKGPDFVSRLSGHINMLGVNPASPDDDLYLIRRALALRFLLAERQSLFDIQLAKVDENMVNAFLYVPSYRHGARSMRMLVDLCCSRDSNTLAMSEMPPIHQLNMQVDGKAFAAFATGQTQPVINEGTI